MESRVHLLLTVNAPLSADERSELEALGLRLDEYLGRGVYLSSGDAGGLEAASTLTWVTEVSPCRERLKLHPELAEASEAASPPRAMAAEEGMEALLYKPERRIRVEVVLHPGIAAEEVAEEVARAAGGAASKLRIGRDKIRLAVPLSRLEALAALPAVRRIERYAPARPGANLACELVRAVALHGPPGLRGQGEIVAICDSGLDSGDLARMHPHFNGRIHRLVGVGRRERTNDPHGHGTHCAGLIAGSSQSAEAPGPITGAAPDARLLVQSVFARGRPLAGIPLDLRDLFAPAHAEGARVHSNSWSQTLLSNRYNKSCEEVDDFVHRHRDFVVVFAVGNEGRRANGRLAEGTVRPPSLAKNCIAVGACESRRPGKSSPWRSVGTWRQRFAGITAILDDGWADNAGGLAPISGRGPTADGRIRPDLVAPGTSILGPRSSLLRRALNAEEAFGTSTDDSYLYLGGTSSAAALVAGCAAVVRQHLRNLLQRSPSAALVKALLINGAEDIPGQLTPSEAPEIPNVSEGWGRVNLQEAIAPAPPFRIERFDEGEGLDTGEEVRRNFVCGTPGLPLKVTLVWTDPPGERLQNDLDLIVRRADGTERHGNMVPGAQGFDRLNNVEQVLWENFPAGPFTVLVRAHRNTFPGQTFALVVRGGM
jgi:serine protease AprX